MGSFLATTRFWAVICTLLASGLVLAGPQVTHADDTHTLRYKFTPGETVRWQVTEISQVRTTIAATTQQAQMDSRSVKAWKVKEVKENGEIVFEHSVEKAVMRHRVTGVAEQVYDSESSEEIPPVFKQASANVGVPLTEITMTPTGEVVSRKDLRELYRPAGESSMTIPLSKDPIAVGSGWNVPQTITVKLKDSGLEKGIKCRQQFTLKSVTDGIAEIQVETVILEPIHDPAIQVQLVHQATKGLIKFNINAGRVIEQRTDIDERVVGAFGPSSSFQMEMKFSEQLLDEQGVGVAHGPVNGPLPPPRK